MKLHRTSRSAALLAAASLALAACGGDDAGTDTAGGLSGTLSGAGSSAQGAAIEAVTAGFQSANPDVTVNYDPSGSGAGRDQFLSGGVAFAGSDAPLDEEELAQAEERCAPGGVVEVPLYISPIAVAFNVPGVESLNLTPEVLGQIFDKKITSFDDPAIAELNPDADLPDLKITPIVRSDESGTTENFTEYLAAAAGNAFPYEPDGNFPVKGLEAAQGTSGVVSAIKAAEGGIGYADASQVGDLGTVAVGVGEEFVEYSPEAAAAVVENSPQLEGRPEGSLALELERDTAESGNYPIVLVSYQIACTAYDDQQTADLVRGFLEYYASEEGQQAAAQNAGSAPISEQLRSDALAQIQQIGAAS